MTGPSDPRWVLAIRTAEQLQGDILAPDRREKLQRVGKLLGLTPFDVSLVIAVVQDQARRGHAPEHCPTAGQAQLCMVGLPQHGKHRRLTWTIAVTVAAVLTVEMFVIGWMLTG